jgi:lipoprotein-releasing system ATP-binding protein
MSKLLEVSNLCKSFRSGNQTLDVLADLSLELNRGDMVAVTGVSGSGKSTLLHLLGGMERPDKGSIRVMGEEVSSLNPQELSRFRNSTVGFVFQFHHLLPEFTALENVMMPLLIRGKSPDEAETDGQARLQDVGLADRGHHRPGELSGGEQQRVGIARALIGPPLLLLADEPTGNLDPHTSRDIGELLIDLHLKHRLTSIIVTHNERLAALTNRTYGLENGRLHLKRWETTPHTPGSHRV